jgi:hypothetical protein
MVEISHDDAQNLALDLIERTSSSDPGKGPLSNIAHLVGRFDPGVDIQSSTPSERPVRFDGFSADLPVSNDPEDMVQRLRETPIRVLSQNGQVGTWNLMVDLIAQSGRYPGTPTSWNGFIVEAERRVWLHLSIDRLTGKVIASDIEIVTE